MADDDPGVRTAVARALEIEQYEVQTANDGLAAIDRVRTFDPDLVVLDLTMPHATGLDVCRTLRNGGDRRAILVLTARHGVEDRVAGLDAGADDYLVKPFALEELLARVRALLRRTTDNGDAPTSAVTVGDLVLDPASRVVRRGERIVDLTRTEFALLELLMRNAGVVLTREVISDRVWGYDEGTANSLDVYVGYVRRKTEEGGEPRIVHTVRGVGFVARADRA